MKRIGQSAKGVTLLEIMLVLAIAAMVIVMSVRYYQSATINQQSNNLLQMIQGVTAGMDGLAQGTGTYSGIGTPAQATSQVQTLMPNKSLTTPWGGALSITAVAATTYTVNITLTPAGVCNQVKTRLAANTQYDVSGTTCPATGNVTFAYTYSSTPP